MKIKKILSILLAVLATLSVCAVPAIADEVEPETAIDVSTLVRMSVNSAEAEVSIIQPGDVLTFTRKPKTVTVTYYPDAASVPASSLKNTKWKAYVDSLQPTVEGETLTLAASPAHYKSFIETVTPTAGTTGSEIVVQSIGGETPLNARDAYDTVMAQAPIDYQLKDASGNDAVFLGWAVCNFSTNSIILYAYWDREHFVKPVDPNTEPEDSDKSEVLRKFDWFLGLFDTSKNAETDWKQYFDFVPRILTILCGAIAALLKDPVNIEKIYDWFGIER